jgi:2,3-bisphosphoglycerate-independent phosphoglycerate mutase
MTHVLVILSGASEPVRGEEPTSLERARTPVLDALAQLGTLRRLRPTPERDVPSAETGFAALMGRRAGSDVDLAETVVITAPGSIAALAQRLGARVIQPTGYDGDPSAPVDALADAALAVLAAQEVARVVIYVGTPAAAGGDVELKVSAIEAADEELLVPLAAAVHELGGVLEIAVDYSLDPDDGRADAAPTPALRWETDAPTADPDGDDAAHAGNAGQPAPDPRDIDHDAPGLSSGLDPEDLPVMAVPKRRASAAAQTGRRLTERWVHPLPIEDLGG